MKSVSISAEKRVDFGKKEAKALRAAGKVPCVVYGGEKIQHLKDEILILKGEKKRPTFKPSKLDKETGESKNNANTKKRPGSNKRSKNAELIYDLGSYRDKLTGVAFHMDNNLILVNHSNIFQSYYHSYK